MTVVDTKTPPFADARGRSATFSIPAQFLFLLVVQAVGAVTFFVWRPNIIDLGEEISWSVFVGEASPVFTIAFALLFVFPVLYGLVLFFLEKARLSHERTKTLLEQSVDMRALDRALIKEISQTE
ncbi:MAG: hypothetical protein AAFO73_02065 [Pseudomonadota bacterium]